MPHGLHTIGCPVKPHGKGQHSQNNNGHRMPSPAPHFENVPPPRALCVNLKLTHTEDFCGKNRRKNSPHFEN
jgi:hypothetical protein